MPAGWRRARSPRPGLLTFKAPSRTKEERHPNLVTWKVRAVKLPILPPYYYLDHFAEMLGFVQRTYGSILTEEHHAFIARFDGLSRDARCL